MNAEALREALTAALAAIDEPSPADDSPTVLDVIEAEAEAGEDRREHEAELEAELIVTEAEAEAAVEVAVIEAEAAAEVAVIEAEAAAEVAVIEAGGEVLDQLEADDGEPADEGAPVLDGPGDLVDDALDAVDDMLDGDQLPTIEPDTAPAPTHWYTRRRTFRRKV